MELVFEKGESFSKPSSGSTTPRPSIHLAISGQRDSRSDGSSWGEDDHTPDKPTTRDGSGGPASRGSVSELAPSSSKSAREKLFASLMGKNLLSSGSTPASAGHNACSRTLPRSSNTQNVPVRRRFSLGPHEGHRIDRTLLTASPTTFDIRPDEEAIWVKSASNGFHRSSSYDQNGKK